MVDISHIRNITVIGAGIMGRGIAQLFLMAGFDNVNLYDIKLETLEEAIKKIVENLKKAEIADKLGERITAIALQKLMQDKILDINVVAITWGVDNTRDVEYARKIAKKSQDALLYRHLSHGLHGAFC